MSEENDKRDKRKRIKIHAIDREGTKLFTSDGVIEADEIAECPEDEAMLFLQNGLATPPRPPKPKK